jgi:peptidoglycan/LPS O-acetylase OafA/YrhL
MQEIKGLTSLRGIAAMAVVLQHFSKTAQVHTGVPIPSLVPHGYLAVDFFFVLSGYIMCYTYLHTFRSEGMRAYLPFLKKRAVRLMPLNAFVTLTMLLLAGLSHQLLNRNIFFGKVDLPIDLLWNLLMLQGLGIGNSMNGPSWSVSVELLAYALFPVLITFVLHRTLAVKMLSGVMAVCALTWVAMHSPHFGLEAETPLFGAVRCLSEFSLGMLAYQWGQSWSKSNWIRSDGLAWVAFAMCLLFLLLRNDLLVALCFPLMVAATAHNTGRVRAGLSRPTWLFMGQISFSLYLIHDLFRSAELILIRALHPTPLTAAQGILFALLGSLSVIPFAWLAYRYVEGPSRNFLLQTRASSTRHT